MNQAKNLTSKNFFFSNAAASTITPHHHVQRGRGVERKSKAHPPPRAPLVTPSRASSSKRSGTTRQRDSETALLPLPLGLSRNADQGRGEGCRAPLAVPPSVPRHCEAQQGRASNPRPILPAKPDDQRRHNRPPFDAPRFACASHSLPRTRSPLPRLREGQGEGGAAHVNAPNLKRQSQAKPEAIHTTHSSPTCPRARRHAAPRAIGSLPCDD